MDNQTALVYLLETGEIKELVSIQEQEEIW